MPDNGKKVFIKSAYYTITNGVTFSLHDYNHNLATLSIGCKEPDWLLNDDQCCKHQMLLMNVHCETLRHLQSPQPDYSQSLLSRREREIIEFISQGVTYSAIAKELNICEQTVKFHRQDIVSKLNATSTKNAVLIALRNGII